MKIRAALGELVRRVSHRGRRPHRNSAIPLPEFLEDRVVLSTVPAAEFSLLGTFPIDPDSPTGDEDLRPQIPVVGHYTSRGGVRTFIAVTFSGDGGGVAVFLPNSRGGFEARSYPTGAGEPEGIIAGQFTGSPAEDLVVACNGGSVVVLDGHGDGTFDDGRPLLSDLDPDTQYTYAAAARIGGIHYLFVSDFAGGSPDGREFGGQLLIYRRARSGEYVRTQAIPVRRPEQVAVADFNHDGAWDLAVASANEDDVSQNNRTNNAVNFFQGDGRGRFALVQSVPVLLPPGQEDSQEVARPVLLTVGAFHGEPGRPDVAVANQPTSGTFGGVNILRNRSGRRLIDFGDSADVATEVGSHPVGVAAVPGGPRARHPALAVAGYGDDTVTILGTKKQDAGLVKFDVFTRLEGGSGPVGIVAVRFGLSDVLIVADSGSDSITILSNRRVKGHR